MSNNSNKLKDVVRNKIAEAHLSDAQLTALNTSLNPTFTPPKPRSNIAIIAGVLFFLGVALMLYAHWQHWSKEQLIIAVAQESVENHLKPLPLTFQTHNLIQLDQQLNELRFTLVNSIQLPNMSNALQGGSYCVIQGLTAAQLRLQAADAPPTSLFQLPFDAKVFARLGNINVDEQPILRYFKGYSVTLWEEKGVLLVLVEAPDTGHLSSGVVRPQLSLPDRQ